MSQAAFEWEAGASTGGADLDTDIDLTLTVSQLNAGIESVIRRAFSDEVWVRGEIKGYNVSKAGHAYFSLVEQTDEGEQTVSIALFSRARQTVVEYLARHRMKLADGIEVRICGEVQFYAPRGQISVRMTGIDPTFTLGRMAADRDALIARLRTAGLTERNKRHRLATVPLRVGLVTSHGSAAYHDFISELSRSSHAWSVVFCDSRVQGPEAADGLVAAIRTLNRPEYALDVICVVRGGGSRTDLAAFDLEPVALAIAGARIPVFVGVGHEIDTSVADLVAHTTVKTPTACAQVLIGQVQQFADTLADTAGRIITATGWQLERAEATADNLARRIGRETDMALRQATVRLDHNEAQVVQLARSKQRQAQATLDQLAERLQRVWPRQLDADTVHLDSVAARVNALDPARLLARGWSITHDAQGALVRSIADVAAGTRLITTVNDGTITSTVEAS